MFFFFSSRRRHTRCALVTGVQTCALPIFAIAVRLLVLDECSAARVEQFLRCGLALGDLGGEERAFLAIQTQAAFRRLQFPVRPLVGIDSLMGCEAHNKISDAARPRWGGCSHGCCDHKGWKNYDEAPESEQSRIGTV